MRGVSQRARVFARSIALALAAVLLAVAATAAPAATAEPSAAACRNLGNGTRIGNAVVLVAQSVPAGDFSDAYRTRLTDLPAFCRVMALSRPHPSSRVLVEIWLPAPGAWNGKLLGTGNGGEAGKIASGALAGGLRRGFATANTDLGTYPAGQPGIGFNFGDGSPEMIRDWAFRGTHEMTVVAKEIVSRYYGRAASKAYFAGCSTGGHQALMEAQRYPDDYDGIIAGAPAHNRTRLHTRFAALRLLGQQPGATLPRSLMQAWRASVLRTCAGRDGGAPGDAFLTDPLRCKASPRSLICKPGDAPEGCFSPAQASALEKVYDGTRNPRTGEMIYFGDLRGAEDQLMLVYGEAFFAPTFDLTNWVLPADRGYATFDFDHDMAMLDDTYAAEVNAVDPDLSAFAARGGKLILFHGWEDGLITATDSIDYFQRIRAADRRPQDFARLFMVPGMGHCAGGPGPSSFGQLADIPPPSEPSPGNDLITALAHWVEDGPAPAAIMGHGMALPNDGPAATEGEIGSRPICAFPAVARYSGKGHRLSARSFVCAKGPVPRYERPAARYLR
jgi:feruloyl esterase